MRRRLIGIVATTIAAIALSFGVSVGAATAISAPSLSYTNIAYDM